MPTVPDTVPVAGWNESGVVLHGGRKNDNGVNSHNESNDQIIFDDCFVYLPRQVRASSSSAHPLPIRTRRRPRLSTKMRGTDVDVLGGSFLGGLQNIWQLQAFESDGGAPVGRYGHTLRLLEPNPESIVLALFGGNGAWDQELGDLWKMHLSETAPRWELMRPECPPEGCPANRTQHAADVIDAKMFVFGGITSGGALSDELWVWDSNAGSGDGSWQRIAASACANDPVGAVPPATAEHTLSAIGSTRLVMFGGNQSTGSNGGGVVTNATWEFDTSTSCWTQLTPTEDKDKVLVPGGAPPRPPHRITVFLTPNRTVFSGRSGTLHLNADAAFFSCPYGIHADRSLRQTLLGRIGHSAVVFNSTRSSTGKEMHVMFGRGAELYPEDISWKLVIGSSDEGLRWARMPAAPTSNVYRSLRLHTVRAGISAAVDFSFVSSSRLFASPYPNDPRRGISSSYEWIPVNITDGALAPVARGGQGIAAYRVSGEPRALIFGGECRLATQLGLPFRDTWSYTPTLTGGGEGDVEPFENLQVLDYPSNLLSHSATLADDLGSNMSQICIFGGLNVRSGFQSSLWCLTVADNAESTHDFSGGYKWRNKRVSTHVQPKARADHSAVYVGGGSGNPQLLVNGGRNHFAVAVNELPLDDTYVYVFNNFSWVKVDATGEAPQGRMAHTSVVETVAGASRTPRSGTPEEAYVIWTFGGVVGGTGTSYDRMTNGTWTCRYNPATYTCAWARVVPAVGSVTIRPRAWHTAFWLNGSMVVWGGRMSLREDLELTNELVIFDPATNAWRNTHPDGVPPMARYAHGSEALSDVRMVIVGGFSKRGVMSDVWVYDAVTGPDGTWTEIEQSISADYPRGYHSVSFHSETEEVLLYGGTSLDLSDSDDSFEGAVPAMTVGCNPGATSAHFATSKCQPCAVGAYADTPGSRVCSSCPRDIITNSTEARSETSCNLCRGGYCENGGVCSVDGDLKPDCKCSMLYANSSQCDALGWYWVAVPTVVIALLILAAMYRKADSLKAMAMSYSAESQAKGRHLVQLYQQWEIEASSIKVTSILGEGQYGAVYRGTYNAMEVAIKKLKTHGLPYEYYAELKESFETEASLMLQFNHPNVVFFYGAGYEIPEGEEHGIPFVVTELAGRGSLAHVLDVKTGPDQIDWAQKLRFALDAATGMMFLHDKDVMHRDLKSANLLVANDFTVKVTDFGTSGLVGRGAVSGRAQTGSPMADMIVPSTPLFSGDVPDEQRALLTADVTIKHAKSFNGREEVVGTMEWMAPELHMAVLNIEGRPEQGKPVDVYAFGVVMWEIATRAMPYGHMDPGPGSSNIRKAVLNGERPVLPESTHVPPRYHSLMSECWTKLPQRRPVFMQVVTRLNSCTVAGRASLQLADNLSFTSRPGTLTSINSDFYEGDIAAPLMPRSAPAAVSSIPAGSSESPV